MNRSRILTWLAAVLIVGSVVAGWIAIGRLAAATERGLARTEQSLSSARDLAVTTAASADEVQQLVGVIGEGLSSTADALVATRQVSTSVRGLLGVASIFDGVQDLTDRLKTAEASIATVEIDLQEASGSVAEAAPDLAKAVVSLKLIPDQLGRSIAEVESSRARIGQQVWLWRLAMAAGGAALAAMLLLIVQLRAAIVIVSSLNAQSVRELT
jgi:hypothetical protein